MKSSNGRTIAALLLTAAVSTACSTASQGTPPGSPAPGDQNTAAAGAESTRPRYNEADARFMTGMIAHHAQAIEIARWAPTHGASASLQVMAERVINAQQDEILLMQTWLRDRGLPAPDPAATAGHTTHAHLMPGMLTEDQLKQLDAARGKEFERLFLTFMIQHHRGAVTMVEELFGSQGAGLDDTVFKLASDISADQTSEIERMQRMLFTLTTGIPTK